jgi:hypothetical protein
MISRAPLFTNLRRSASRITLRSGPVKGRGLSARFTLCPVRSRPSRREPSHSPAASCASFQVNCHRYASPSRWDCVPSLSRAQATVQKISV